MGWGSSNEHTPASPNCYQHTLLSGVPNSKQPSQHTLTFLRKSSSSSISSLALSGRSVTPAAVRKQQAT